jgi:hypothetical protein
VSGPRRDGRQVARARAPGPFAGHDGGDPAPRRVRTRSGARSRCPATSTRRSPSRAAAPTSSSPRTSATTS